MGKCVTILRVIIKPEINWKHKQPPKSWSDIAGCTGIVDYHLEVHRWSPRTSIPHHGPR